LRTDGLFSLVMQKGSFSPYEILLLGGNFDEKIAMNDTDRVVRLEIRKKIESNLRPLAYYIDVEKNENIKFYKLMKKSKCE
jgi:hypothetical protein